MILKKDNHMNWSRLIDRLRAKWKEVPSGGDDRLISNELLIMSDSDLLALWEKNRANATTGEFYSVRGWYHELYKDVFRGKKVLDVGSGFGIDGLSFAQCGAEVTCLDIVESNLRILERLSNLLNLENVNFHYLHEIKDIDRLPFDYDIIWCQGSLINAPQSIVREEIQSLVQHLKIGGRWVELAYPKVRWEREGRLSFKDWGERTDGGAPWVEWYDLEKLMQCFDPHRFEVILYFEFHDSDFNWFDLVRRS